MKKAIIAAVIVVVCLIGLPLVLGMQTESMIRNNIESMNGNAVLAFDIESYERRWRSSTARIAIGLDQDYLNSIMSMSDVTAAPFGAAALADIALDVIVEIDHGPVAFNDGLFVGLARISAGLDEDSAILTEVRNRLAMPYLVKLDGEVGFTGTFDFVTDVPTIDYADESGEVSFSGAIIEGNIGSGRLVADGNIDSVIIASPFGTASVQGVHGTTDIEVLSGFLWVGDTGFVIDSIVVGDPFGGPDPVFAADALSVTSTSQLDDSETLLSAEVVYAAESVTAGNGEIDLADMELGIQVGNLHVETLNAYYETMLNVDMADPERFLLTVQSLVGEALTHDPTFALDPIRFRLFDEPFDGNVSVRLNENATQNGIDFSNVLMLASSVEATANFTASKTLAARLATESLKVQLAAALAGQPQQGQDIDTMAETQAQLMLAASLGQGFILADGENYTTTIEFNGGQILINGNPLPLGMF